MSNDNETTSLPRRDLREPAFRKYEPYIYRILTEPMLEVNCRVELQLTSTTFIARFRDAILGFRKYGYESRIPKFTDFYFIKIEECPDDIVRIYNTTLYKVWKTTEKLPGELHATRDFDAIMERIRLLTTYLEVDTSKRMSYGPYFVIYDTLEERRKIEMLSDEHNKEDGHDMTVREVKPGKLKLIA